MQLISVDPSLKSKNGLMKRLELKTGKPWVLRLENPGLKQKQSEGWNIDTGKFR